MKRSEERGWAGGEENVVYQAGTGRVGRLLMTEDGCVDDGQGSQEASCGFAQGPLARNQPRTFDADLTVSSWTQSSPRWLD